MKSCVVSFVLVFTLGASGAFAQAMYKSTMPDGKVIYGEKPAPGAKQVETVTPPPPKSGISVVTPADKAKVDQRVKQRAATEDAKRREVEAATKQLQQAEAALEAGKEPLPGERLGIVGGGTRLTDEYWARQKRLEAAVEAARKRLDQAQQAAAR